MGVVYYWSKIRYLASAAVSGWRLLSRVGIASRFVDRNCDTHCSAGAEAKERPDIRTNIVDNKGRTVHLRRAPLLHTPCPVPRTRHAPLFRGHLLRRLTKNMAVN